MAKSIHQKEKLLRLLDIFMQKTDENHAISMKELIDELAKYEIEAERKSIYNDIAILQDMGYDIVWDKTNGYFLASRKFEKKEILPLVDAISSSRFITEKRSRELISKLEGLLSIYDAKDLHREVYVKERIKAENESILNLVDVLHDSIHAGKQVSFLYCEWNMDKELVPRYGGKRYIVSPLSMMWDDEKYYLIAFSEEYNEIRHYRVDKMKAIKKEEVDIVRNDITSHFDVVGHFNRSFGMYGGKEETVTLRVAKDKVGIIIDRFGKDISFRKVDGDCVLVRVNVAVSPQFFAWVLGISGGIRIEAPAQVREEFLNFLKKSISEY